MIDKCSTEPSIAKEKIISSLKKLKTNKATEPDNIPGDFLKIN